MEFSCRILLPIKVSITVLKIFVVVVRVIV
jgi:hypothetical protein